MENREFFDVIVACMESKDLPWARAGFNTFATRCGYSENCLDTYDENVEYRRIFLSDYYNSVVWEDELDFDGKPFGPPGGNDTVLHIEAIMKTRETVSQYICRGSLTWISYSELVDKYNLVT